MPNWGTTKGYTGKQKTIIKFNDFYSCNFEEEIYSVLTETQ